MSDQDGGDEKRTIADLIGVMAALRTPVTGCPWDLEQDFAIDRALHHRGGLRGRRRHRARRSRRPQGRAGRSPAAGRLSRAPRRGAGALRLSRRRRGITTKMIRRHPHVFGDEEARTAGMAKGAWERIKAEERAGEGRRAGAAWWRQQARSRRSASLCRRARRHARPHARRQVAGQSRPGRFRLALACPRARQDEGGDGRAGSSAEGVRPSGSDTERRAYLPNCSNRSPGVRPGGPTRPRHRGGIRRPAVRDGQRRPPSAARPGGGAAAAPTTNSSAASPTSRPASPSRAAPPVSRPWTRWTATGTRCERLTGTSIDSALRRMPIVRTPGLSHTGTLPRPAARMIKEKEGGQCRTIAARSQPPQPQLQPRSCSPPPCPAAAQSFYEGQQIILLVGSGVGGGYDVYSRLVARHWAKHIPGKPTFVVQNHAGRRQPRRHQHARQHARPATA